MNIALNKLTLEYFKGIRSLEIDFSDKTCVYGQNATGKSTIFDAFCWLLFGKNSHDDKDFGIKTLENGKAIPQVDHSVTGILTVDGQKLTLKRIYTEKWTRRRGAEETELTGHETAFFIDGVPLQAGEYKTKVDSLISEGLFKLLTSATYFNNLPWKDRRQVLIAIAGEITDSEVTAAMDKAQVKTLIEIINSGKSLDDFRKQVSIRKKELSDALKLIPPRIDEVKRGIPQAADFEQAKKDLYERQVALLEAETAITDKVKGYEEQANIVQAKQKEIHALKTKLQTLEFEARNAAMKDSNARTYKINDIKLKAQGAKSELSTLERALEGAKANAMAAADSLVKLRATWQEESARTLVFKEGEFICPTCKRDLDPETIGTRREIMLSDFDKSKTDKLAAITKEGNRLKGLQAENELTMHSTQQSIEVVGARITLLEGELKEAESTPSYEVELPKEHAVITKAISEMELQVMEVPAIDIEGLKIQKAGLQADIDRLKGVLATEELIKKGNARVKELAKEEKDLAGQLADLEKQEYAMAQYERCRMDTVEQRVNGKFSLVRWKMFDTQINGAVVECCEATVNGVPYSDVNSGHKIKAGLDCIQTLSDHYGITAPVFIDNSETVSDMPLMVAQMVCMYVSSEEVLTIK